MATDRPIDSEDNLTADLRTTSAGGDPHAALPDGVVERPEPVPTNRDVILGRLDAKEWTPLQRVAPKTEDVACLISLLDDGTIEYRREVQDKVEYIRLTG